MEQFAQFHFIRPWWFLLLIPWLACLSLLIHRRFRAGAWEKICDAALLPHILIQTETVKQKWSTWLFACTGLLAIIALAGPTWERLPQPVFRTDSALVIALDLSRSMDAPDLAPSRLERARFKVIDLLDRRNEGETAMIVYAGDAFTVSPLTADVKTIKSQLPAISTSLMPLQGHRADLALELSVAMMKQAGHAEGDIVILTDEVDVERDSKKAAEVRADGYRVSVLGIGTEQGAPITLANGGFLKNRNGEIVIPKLDADALQQLALAGGGVYRSLQPTSADVDLIMRLINQVALDMAETETEFESDVWREQGPWLVLLILPLAALGFRRGVLISFVVMMLPMPRPVQAVDWDALWLNDNQRAEKLLQQGEIEQATKLFKDKNWQAAAQYRNKQFDASLETWRNNEDVQSRYNAGNALARLQRYEEAIAAYESVLEQQPEHEDAQYNLNLIKKELEKQQKQPPQNQSGGGEKKPDREQGEDQAEQSDNDSPPPENQSGRENTGDQQAESKTDPEQDGKQSVSKPGEHNNQEDIDRQQQGRPGDQSDESTENRDKTLAGNTELSEEDRATEQWLRRIPDDPGGLLREKFRLQYKQRGMGRHNYEQDW